MGCEQIRSALSARLDGEEDPAERSVIDAHLARCADCAAWHRAAARLGPLLHAGSEPTPALSAAVIEKLVAAGPGPGWRRFAAGLRLLLGTIGVVQFLLGVIEIAVLSGGANGHVHPRPEQSVAAGHLWHESAAWGIAVGAGFVWIAWRRIRPGGVLPVLGVFVAVLTLLTVNDAFLGRVEANRILSHSLIVGGYLVLLVLARPRFTDLEPPTGDRGRPGWRLLLDDDTALATVHRLPVQARVRGGATASRNSVRHMSARRAA